MKRAIVGLCFTSASLFLPSCNSTTEIIDQSGAVKGVVVDSRSGQVMDSVTVAWKVHSYPDSLLFQAGIPKLDSIAIGYNIRALTMTDSNGRFYVQASLSPTPPFPYEDMFAYKHGYQLWRFDSTRDRTYRVRTYEDSIAIVLNHE